MRGLGARCRDELPGGILLVAHAKGIYKPASTEYPLSVRRVAEEPYADSPLRTRADASWTLEYCQAGHGGTFILD